MPAHRISAGPDLLVAPAGGVKCSAQSRVLEEGEGAVVGLEAAWVGVGWRGPV